LKFIKDRKVLFEASNGCNYVKNRDCRRIDEKLLSGLKSLGGSERAPRRHGIFPVVTGDKDD
jgi:hypothetical protein